MSRGRDFGIGGRDFAPGSGPILCSALPAINPARLGFVSQAKPAACKQRPSEDWCRCVAPGCGKSPAYVTGIALDIILLSQLAGVKSSNGNVSRGMAKTVENFSHYSGSGGSYTTGSPVITIA